MEPEEQEEEEEENYDSVSRREASTCFSDPILVERPMHPRKEMPSFCVGGLQPLIFKEGIGRSTRDGICS